MYVYLYVYTCCYVYVYVDWLTQLIIIMRCRIECHIHSHRPVYLLYTSHTCRPPPHQARSLIPATINRGAAAPVLHHYHNRPAHARWTTATNVTSVATATNVNICSHSLLYQ